MASNVLTHLQLLGMKRNPFPLAPDASGFFMSARMREHVVEILHCIEARKGFVLITGEVGMGKTTLGRRLMQSLSGSDTHTAMVLNSFLQGRELIAAINRDFGIASDGGLDECLTELNRFLMDRFRNRKNCVIMIDDAQNLNPESLELLRQISNLETGQEKLVQLVLIAQPEIMRTLARPEIRQLASRLALVVRLAPIRGDDILAYVRFRLEKVAGGRPLHLGLRARRALGKHSRGAPRRINLIMDRCLYAVAASRLSRIPASLVHRAASELDMFDKQPVSRRAHLIVIACMVAAGVFGLSGFLYATQISRSFGVRSASQSDAPSTKVDFPAAPSEVSSQRNAGNLSMKLPLEGWHHFSLNQRSPAVTGLQQALAREGFYHAPVDGIVGPKTLIALARYQAEHDLPVTVWPDHRTLSALGISSSDALQQEK